MQVSYESLLVLDTLPGTKSVLNSTAQFPTKTLIAARSCQQNLVFDMLGESLVVRLKLQFLTNARMQNPVSDNACHKMNFTNFYKSRRKLKALQSTD